MKHIKSYEDYLLESESAKAIEDRVKKMGEPQDKADALKKDLEDKTGDLSKAELKAAAKADGGDDDKTKEMDAIKKDLSSDKPSEPARQGYDDREDETMEKHDKYDARLVSMTLGKVLDKLKQKDPTGYADIEKYLEKNFKDLTSADESWFTTMTS